MHNTTFIRSLILTFFTAISPSLALAQKNVGTKPLKRLEATHDDEDVETVLEIDEGAFYGYGGFRAGTQYIDSKFVNVVGFRAAWLFNRNISIGLDASSSSYKPFKKNTDRAKITQDIVGLGLLVEKIYNPFKRTHFTAAFTLGQGSSKFSNDIENLPLELQGRRRYYYLAPESTLTLNATKYLRLFTGASLYLPFGGSGNKEINEKKFLGSSIFVGFNFGSF